MKDDTPKPLLFDEIMTIALYGTIDEQERLDRYLEMSYSEELEYDIFALAEHIRDRRQIGMRWRCCPQCRYYGDCKLKWYRQERDIPTICCYRCQHHKACVADFRLGRGCCLDPEQPG